MSPSEGVSAGPYFKLVKAARLLYSEALYFRMCVKPEGRRRLTKVALLIFLNANIAGSNHTGQVFY
jgi:hypothetical protein